MRVLITGLDGFTGIHLKRELNESGHLVFGLKCDLNDVDSMNKQIKEIQPDAVMHLAALSFINSKEVGDFYKVNLIGTLNLLEALSNFSPNVRTVILASSANIYGNSEKVSIDEKKEPNPINDYSVSKLSMENMAKLWLDRLPIVIVRPFNYTGYGQNKRFIIPKIVSHFQNNEDAIELGNIDVYREYTDVRDVVNIYAKLLEGDFKGELFNICSGNYYSIKEVIELCENITERKINIKINKNFIRENDIKILYGSNGHLLEKIKKTNWHNLEDTLRWMLYAEYGDLKDNESYE